MQVNVAEAKNKLTQLIRKAEKGEPVTICRHGKAVVKLVPAEPERKPRIFGANRGGKIIDPDWAKPQNDIDAWLRGDV